MGYYGCRQGGGHSQVEQLEEVISESSKLLVGVYGSGKQLNHSAKADQKEQVGSAHCGVFEE